MKILASNQIHEVDRYTIIHEPISSGDLMERAATACYGWITTRYPDKTMVKIFIGPGNNGGDGLAIAYLLLQAGYQVHTYVLFPQNKFSQDALQKFQRLMEGYENTVFLIKEPYIPVISPGDLVIDALFGTGLTRPLSGYPSHLINQINKSGAQIIAIDVPSGLFCDTNEGNNRDTIIKAHHTLTFGMPKLAFMFAENYVYSGELHILDIKLHPAGIEEQETRNFYLSREDIVPLLKTRSKFAHKGIFGHALLISGSFGKMGAAVMASKACLKTGVGLLTSHIPRKGYDILQTSVPEAMVSLDNNYDMVSEFPDQVKYNAIGIGPGIGTSHETTDVLREVLSKAALPIVMDADALNIMAMNQWLLCMIPPLTILTPHPKEFDRLAGESPNSYKRYLNQLDFSKKYNVIIVLKGAHTSITTPKGNCWFNSTGNPGMATAGSGDVLTGIILSFLAQGYEPETAAMLGVYLHGLAGDIALSMSSVESMIASDIINHIGNAFNNIRNNS
ncbi:MAG: NAD(P)H-hydrate dehydratase [Bacteroidetes bacterium]|nr:NAD(P)H-hydrate dehydratase [Bacteroidota bacterium]